MMSSYWKERRKRDVYHRMARERGLRSRAYFKLKEVIDKHKLIKSGDVVVDLGAAPGGWMVAALEAVGPKGFVLGVDLVPIKPFDHPSAAFIVADITSGDVIEAIKSSLPRRADVVISDVSPKISGVWEVDHARQMELAHASLEVAKEVLRRGGSFFTKVFEGDMLSDFVREVKACFRSVKLIKPKASRKHSAEMYVLARGFVGA